MLHPMRRNFSLDKKPQHNNFVKERLQDVLASWLLIVGQHCEVATHTQQGSFGKRHLRVCNLQNKFSEKNGLDVEKRQNFRT